jgi:hypothetical protein
VLSIQNYVNIGSQIHFKIRPRNVFNLPWLALCFRGYTAAMTRLKTYSVSSCYCSELGMNVACTVCYRASIRVWSWILFLRLIIYSPPPKGSTALVGQGLLTVEASRSHSDTPQSVGLPWTSDQPVAETSTRQHTTLTRDKHPCPRRDSNPQSQQASDARSLGSVPIIIIINLLLFFWSLTFPCYFSCCYVVLYF